MEGLPLRTQTENSKPKINRILYSIILILVVYAIFGEAKYSAAETINSASCSPEDISAAVAGAASGDTILVPAGSCIWTNGIIITKGVILKGAGAESTIITSNLPSPNDELILYQPSDASANQVFRITGFTLDENSKSAGIELYNTDYAKVITNVRIDKNKFSNCMKNTYPCFRITGNFYGLIDNNIFSGSTPFEFVGGNDLAWDNFTGSFGDKDAMYIEDNIFTMADTIIGSARGIKWVMRYNSFTYNGVNALSPWFDAHGNQPGRLYAVLSTEIYGNFLADHQNKLANLFAQRGGMSLTFNNSTTTSGSPGIGVREEYDDSICPTTNPQPQHVSNSYIWNNRKADNSLITAANVVARGRVSGGGSNYLEDSSAYFNFCETGCPIYGVKITGGTGAGQYRQLSTITTTRLNIAFNWTVNPDNTSTYEIKDDCCDAVSENIDFFNQNDSFNGTGGMGAGPLSSRPSSCSTGVGYWATTQSTSTVDPTTIGAHPAQPISGTLYKCTAPNTWTAYYTPFTYPHPMRTDCLNFPTLCAGDTTPPTRPTGLGVQ